jgi:hypothetical protein
LVLLESASKTESLIPLCFTVLPVVFGTAATEMRGIAAALTGTPLLLLLLLALLLPLLPKKHMKQFILS